MLSYFGGAFRLCFPTFCRVAELILNPPPRDSDAMSAVKFVIKTGSPQAARTELQRVLSSDGWVFLARHGFNEFYALRLIEEIADEVDAGAFRQTKPNDLPPCNDPEQDAFWAEEATMPDPDKITERFLNGRKYPL